MTSGNHDEAFLDAFMASDPHPFFHIDWNGKFEAKTFIGRTKLTCKNNSAIDSFAADLGLDSLSLFGEKHLWGDREEWATACRETMCEWIRRERYADEISRFHSFFGFKSIEDVHAFSEREKLHSPAIWRVLAVDYSDGKDMKWFDRSGTLLEKLHFIDCYWRGMPAEDTPSWEYLLHPSIYVKQRVL